MLKLISANIQGEYVENCHLERSHQPTVLRWHPTKPVLAVGWENGEIVLLTHPSGDQTVLPSTHTASVTLLEWSSSGSRLVTGDQVCVAMLRHLCLYHIYTMMNLQAFNVLVGPSLMNEHFEWNLRIRYISLTLALTLAE